MKTISYYLMILEEISEWADDIQAKWSGEENDRLEENAHIAQEIKEKSEEIIDLIKTLN